VLAKATEGAAFVFLGEDHGVSQVAELATALHAMLQPQASTRWRSRSARTRRGS